MNKLFYMSGLIGLFFMQFFCGGNQKMDSIENYADLVIINGDVFTGDSSLLHAEALAVKNDTILAVGKTADIEKLIQKNKTAVIDARGKTVTAGFNDAHLHFVSGGRVLMEVDLREVSSNEQLQQIIANEAAKRKSGELIRGFGWNHELFIDKQWPDCKLLDAVTPDNPVVLTRVDGHSLLVNSYVLKLLKIDEKTPVPAGGEIVLDAASNKPTGIFKESAADLIDNHYGQNGENTDMQYNRQALRLSFKDAARFGVTSIQHLTGHVELLEELKKEGLLTARVTFGVPISTDDQVLSKYQDLQNKYPRSGNWIRFGFVKGFMDGTLGSGTAMLFAPYSDEPEKTGLPQYPYDQFEAMVVKADQYGFQIGVHAIGPKANHWVLNAYEKAANTNPARERRHRIEHAQILIKEDILRFKALNVIASMQPTHCITDKNFAEKRLGTDRCHGAYAWKTLLNSGAHLAFGTDWPIEPLNPMQGLYAAITRKDIKGEDGQGWFPEEKLTLEEALYLYTHGAAYAEWMEERKGLIKPGMLADVIVFDSDLFSIPALDLLKTKIRYTIVGGKIVYQET
jgi:predicted amidohydrolase YtcJ